MDSEAIPQRILQKAAGIPVITAILVASEKEAEGIKPIDSLLKIIMSVTALRAVCAARKIKMKLAADGCNFTPPQMSAAPMSAPQSILPNPCNISPCNMVPNMKVRLAVQIVNPSRAKIALAALGYCPTNIRKEPNKAVPR